MAMMPHERSLVRKLENRPFALIGVNGDSDLDELRKDLAKHKISWRSFWNGPTRDGPISLEWLVEGWPMLYLIDHKGVIRYKWSGAPGDKVLEEAIEKLLKEAEANK